MTTTAQVVAWKTYAAVNPSTHVVKPFSALMICYQKYLYLRGTLPGIIMLTTPEALAAAAVRDRNARRAGGTWPRGDRRLSGPA